MTAATTAPKNARLQARIGHASLTGPRPRNEDFCGAVTPDGAELDTKGILAVVADGVGGHANGREASEYTVRGLLSDYYATPDTWAVNKALDTVLNALNRWLVSQASRTREAAGMATTLSAIVVRGRRFYTAHVGDSRIYRLRDGRFEQLTTDHLWEHPELKNVLSRAIGLDPGHEAADRGRAARHVGLHRRQGRRGQDGGRQPGRRTADGAPRQPAGSAAERRSGQLRQIASQPRFHFRKKRHSHPYSHRRHSERRSVCGGRTFHSTLFFSRKQTG